MNAKASLRQQFRARRLALLPEAQPAIEAQARRHCPALVPPGRHLGLYWPLAGEVDLRSLQALLPNQLALPAITAAPGDPTARLVYRPWRSSDVLEPDGCGIPAPAALAAAPDEGALAAEQLGLLLIPALACDGAGIRLGYGGGWYDRLRADPAWAAVPALVVLPAACLAAALPRDGWDVPFSGWLDEHGLHGLQGPLAV